MGPCVRKRLSKEEFNWFISILVLLILLLIVTLILLVYAISSLINPPSCSSQARITRPLIVYHSSIPLLPQERGRIKFYCIGAVVSKYSILTASPCGQNYKTVYLRGRHIEVTRTNKTEMFNVQYQNYTLIQSNDLQLTLIKLTEDLTKHGFSILQLPPLNYSVVYRGIGSVTYGSKEGIKVTHLSFIHPYYCHLVYERSRHIIDFNLMICAINDLNKNKKICLQNALGSPLIQNGVLVGILTESRLPTCGEIKRPFVFINIIPYLQWFQTHNIKYL